MEDPDVKYLEYIPVEPSRNLILARLGYRKGITAISERDNLFIDSAVKKALLSCNARGAFCRDNIYERSEYRVVLENGIELISEKLSAFLYHSSEIVFMSSTVGREIGDKITEEMNNGNASLGLIYDAVASQVVDAALDWMMNFINKTIKIKGKALTRRRFSPGYGDLNLYHQKVIYDILDLKRIDISITEKFMLEPEKSVIAIAGIEVSHE